MKFRQHWSKRAAREKEHFSAEIRRSVLRGLGKLEPCRRKKNEDRFCGNGGVAELKIEVELHRSGVPVDDVSSRSIFRTCDNGKASAPFKYENRSRAVRFASFPRSEQLVGRVVSTTGNEHCSESDDDA